MATDHIKPNILNDISLDKIMGVADSLRKGPAIGS
jgi:hypothetical protein